MSESVTTALKYMSIYSAELYSSQTNVVVVKQETMVFHSLAPVSAGSGSDTAETCWPVEAGSHCWDAFWCRK